MMTKKELKAFTGQYIIGIARQVFEAIEQFPPEFDERNVMKAVNILVDNDVLSTEQLIKKLKIADCGPGKKKWAADKSNEYTFQNTVKKPKENNYEK